MSGNGNNGINGGEKMGLGGGEGKLPTLMVVRGWKVEQENNGKYLGQEDTG